MKKIIHINIALFSTFLVSCFPFYWEKDDICWGEPYEAFIVNATDDTLYMTFPLLHMYPYSDFDTTTIVIPTIPDEIDDTSHIINPYYLPIYPKPYPYDTIIVINPNSAKTFYKCHCSILSLGQDSIFLDTLRVYRNGSIVIEWYPPLRKMSKDSNSFYNENSWTREKDGADTIETITITEDDYGHAF